MTFVIKIFIEKKRLRRGVVKTEDENDSHYKVITYPSARNNVYSILRMIESLYHSDES